MSGMGPLMGDISWMSLQSNGFVLELGTFTGEGSTRAIQAGLVAKSVVDKTTPLHISVDWEDNLTLNRPTVDWWWMVKGDTRSRDTMERVKSIMVMQWHYEVRRPGLIFIDTDHNYDQMKAELELWGELAGERTVWLFHDTHMYGVPNSDMVRAIKEYAEKNNWQYEDYRQDSHGLGRMRK